MDRIKALFSQSEPILSIYYTAGYPVLESTRPILEALQKSGRVGMVEIGIPYSDPLADGPVIQHSGSVAIANGMTIQKLFDQLRGMRAEVEMPVILMGYLNPILQFGFSKFLTHCAECGIDGLIIPDLPIDEFRIQYSENYKNCGINPIFLVTPQTTENRIREIDSVSEGFIYAVAMQGVTGGATNMNNQDSYFKSLKSMKLRNSVLAGFGIRDCKTFQAACSYVQGAIVGSAFIESITEDYSSAHINEVLSRFADIADD